MSSFIKACLTWMGTEPSPFSLPRLGLFNETVRSLSLLLFPPHLTIINVKASPRRKLSTALTAYFLFPYATFRKQERMEEDNRSLIKEFLINCRFVERVQEILIGTNFCLNRHCLWNSTNVIFVFYANRSFWSIIMFPCHM